MGKWNSLEQKDPGRNESKNNGDNCVSRKEMFQALLKVGVKPKKLDGIPTKDM